jgi:hypothetical protein
MHGHQVAPIVQLAAHVIAAHLTLNSDRNANRNVSISSLEINVGSQIGRQLQVDCSIPGLDRPVLRHRRARQHSGLDPAVACAEIQLVKAALRANVTVAGMGAQIAVHLFDLDCAIATLQVHVSLQSLQTNAAVARAEIDLPLLWHANHDFDPMAPGPDRDAEMVWKLNLHIHRIARLVLDDLNAAFADLLAGRHYPRLDRVLIPGIHTNVGVRGIDS